MIRSEKHNYRKPIMIFAGEFWDGASGTGLADGFRSMGWAVQEVDYRHYGASNARSIPIRIASRLTRNSADYAYRQRLIAECQGLMPDIFLTIKGTAIDQETLLRIKETGAIAAMYYPDVHFKHPGVFEDSFSDYDLFVTTKKFQLQLLRMQLGDERVAYVPHGYVDRVHAPIHAAISLSDFGPDVLYAGNHSAYKQKWLEGLMERNPSLDLSVVGSRWKENSAGGPLARAKMLGLAQSVAYASAIQLAKINIAIHMGPTSSGWFDLVSTRTFEIPACRGFMLHIDSDEVREFFTPGVEIDVFSTVDELVDKVTFYLGRPELRRQMIERAYARCVPAYGYGVRAQEVSQLLQRKLLSKAVP